MKRRLLLVLVLVLFVLPACSRPAPALSPGPDSTPTPTPEKPVSAAPGTQAAPLRIYPEVILGKDNWLFFGDPINELMRNGGLNDNEIDRMVKELVGISDSLEQRGIAFLFLLVPDKYLIYPEFMPDVYREADVPSSYDRLSEALSQSGIDFIDAKTLLLEKKEETPYRLYYLRDQNWNELGNFYVMQEILAYLDRKYPVPEFQLLSVDTSETRISDGPEANDLNDIIKNLSPWQERGAPEPVYNLSPEPQAPPVLWYGTCFSPEVINMMQDGWPSAITYCSLWEQYGFPLSLRYDIDHRLTDQKVVIFEMDEHYRQELSQTLVPEPPTMDLTPFTRAYDWPADTFLRNWAPESEYNIQEENALVSVTADEPNTSLSFLSTARLRLDSGQQYYLVVKVTSPGVAGLLVDFSKTTKGDYAANGRRARYLYEGENTLVFEFPDPATWGTVKSIRLHLGEKTGVFGISQVAIYARSK
ncbi:MAG: hypothetical protein ABIH70_03475 [Chloroflexota bacterium]